jgi:hypothetical protein
MATEVCVKNIHGYAFEILLIPTYLSVFLLLAGMAQFGVVGILIGYFSIILCRRVIEFLYRIIFRSRPLEIKIGIVMLSLQILGWGELWRHLH